MVGLSLFFNSFSGICPKRWGFCDSGLCRTLFGGRADRPASGRLLHGCKVEGGPDLATFRQNVEATIPALRRYARALTRDSDIADDLVQDTLVRALRSEHLFHGGDVRSWLYTILTNLNRNRLRSLARRPTLSPIEDNDAPDLAGPEAGGRDIERALATLVEDQRNALLLVVLEGLSYREVAEVQGVPIGTVMSRLARARVQIKNYLDGGRPALRRVK